MKTYSTSEIAELFDLHPNTIRFYEKMKLMPKIDRKENSYRIFTNRHILQIKLIRIAFHSEILASNLRNQVIEIIKSTAIEDIQKALTLAKTYQENLENEENNAKEAITIVSEILDKIEFNNEKTIFNNRQAAADYLGVTKNVLREWERSGLLSISRDSSGNNLYKKQNLQRAKVIRTLRSAHYSMMAILRMLNTLEYNNEVDLLKIIDTPVDEDIITAADRFITTLRQAREDTQKIIEILNKIQVLSK